MKRSLWLLAAFAAVLALSACGGGGGSAPAGGIVYQLTGDPDDQVSADLQEKVGRAVQRGPFDDPIDD